MLCEKHDFYFSETEGEECAYCREDREIRNVKEKVTAPKFNQGKTRLHLCPPFLKKMMVSELEYGCIKYFKWSWMKGFLVSDMYDATNRHLDAWFYDREEIDEESGCHHLDCALFSLAMIRYSLTIEGMDNRPPVTKEQIAEVIRLGMIELEKRKGETTCEQQKEASAPKRRLPITPFQP